MPKRIHLAIFSNPTERLGILLKRLLCGLSKNPVSFRLIKQYAVKKIINTIFFKKETERHSHRQRELEPNELITGNQTKTMSKKVHS